MYNLTFSKFDYYVVFLVIFVVNICSGVYFAYFSKRQSTKNEYLLGGKSMKPLPIALSLIASHMSANMFLSVPGDVYRHGAAYFLGGISTFLMSLITIYGYLPVFYKLQVTSVFEYLELRFDYRTRLFASTTTIILSLLYLPIIIYVPSLAFAAVSGVNIHLMATCISFICIFYTAIGGLKAVVWTDSVQFVFTVAALVLVTIIGLKSTGGFSEVWQKAVEGEKVNIFDFDLDPTKRDTFWSVVIGLTVLRMSVITVSQSCVQKFLSVSTFRESTLSVIYFGIGLTVVKSVVVLLGLILYAKYSTCDPVWSHKVKTDEQILPYFVMEIAQNVPGLPGLFIAGIFSASLSTLSADLNCLSGIIYEDCFSKIAGKNLTGIQATIILKTIVVCIGLISLLLVYVIEHLGSLFTLSLSLAGISGGSILGMFTLGLFFPIANATGAYYGGIFGVLTLANIILPSHYLKSQRVLTNVANSIGTESCYYFNETLMMNKIRLPTSSTPNFIFRISFYYYTLIGALVTIVVGLIISVLTQEDNKRKGFSKIVSHNV